ncbi:MAG: cytochrome b/b6 domain-containing protein [Sterolibacterium sp.]
MNQSILVWDLPTRVFHWSLVCAFAGAMITADSHRLLLAHAVCGYLLLLLVGFRLVWGIAGSRYARFSEFVRGPTAVITHLRSLFGGNPARHVGHNPAGAVAIIGLLVLGGVAATSGLATLNSIGGKPMKEFHESVGNIMLALAIAHLLGVIVTSFLLRENLVLSMFTGCKGGAPEYAVKTNHGLIALLLLIVLAVFAWALAQGQLPTLLDPATVAEKMSKEHHHRKHDE